MGLAEKALHEKRLKADQPTKKRQQHLERLLAQETFVGLDNYRPLAADPIFWSSLFNNVAYADRLGRCQVGSAASCSPPCSRRSSTRRLKGVLRTVYFIPAVLSLTVTGLLFQFMYNPQIGLVNGLLDAARPGGLEALLAGRVRDRDLGDHRDEPVAVVGYVAVLFIVAMQRIPRELYEAAYLDGASRVQAFRRITVPLVREMTLLGDDHHHRRARSSCSTRSGDDRRAAPTTRATPSAPGCTSRRSSTTRWATPPRSRS